MKFYAVQLPIHLVAIMEFFFCIIYRIDKITLIFILATRQF